MEPNESTRIVEVLIVGDGTDLEQADRMGNPVFPIENYGRKISHGDNIEPSPTSDGYMIIYEISDFSEVDKTEFIGKLSELLRTPGHEFFDMKINIYGAVSDERFFEQALELRDAVITEDPDNIVLVHCIYPGFSDDVDKDSQYRLDWDDEDDEDEEDEDDEEDDDESIDLDDEDEDSVEQDVDVYARKILDGIDVNDIIAEIRRRNPTYFSDHQSTDDNVDSFFDGYYDDSETPFSFYDGFSDDDDSDGKKISSVSKKRYGRSAAVINGKHPKRDIKRHNIIITSKKNHRNDTKIVRNFLRDFMPGKSTWIEDYRTEILNRWMNAFAITEKEAKRRQTEYNRHKKRATTKKRVRTMQSIGQIVGTYNPFYDPKK